MNVRLSRRDFLKATAMFSTLSVAPQFLVRAAESAATGRSFKDDRVLVVVQLGGGNDGLNTLVPHSNDAYYRVRPRLGLKADRVIPITSDIAFNNRLVDLMRLYEGGQLAIVQGVGYPNPDRSHFRSMEIWQTASRSDEYLGSGWIGRYFDNCCGGEDRPQVGVALGQERPQAFNGGKGFGIAFTSPEQYGWREGRSTDTEETFRRLNEPDRTENGTLDFLRHTTSNAILSSHQVQDAARRSGHEPGKVRGAEALQTVAALIRGGLATRIYYVAVSGFDTHANQLGQQDNLLERVGKALAAFQETLRRDGTADRVITMVFSEFGRRVAENASGGTDHGTAAPMFLVGEKVKPGLYGSLPDLTHLDNGDLRYAVDFRSVYATLLEDWFAADSQSILHTRHPKLGLLA